MDKVVCPHCKSHRIVTSKVPRDVVVVMPCPACHELCVLFRDKVIPLSRRIIEQGSFEERKAHLANIIAEFLDPSLLGRIMEGMEEGLQRAFEDPRLWRPAVSDEPEYVEDRGEITEEEVARFLKFELKCLDNSAYFKRHFG